jgi:hypothetical protein
LFEGFAVAGGEQQGDEAEARKKGSAHGKTGKN